MKRLIIVAAMAAAAGLALLVPRPLPVKAPSAATPMVPAVPASRADRGAPPLTAEQSRDAHIAVHHALVAMIRSQERNAAWAARAETEIRQQLKEARPTDATITRVDCRRDACLVTVRWGSFHAARDGWETLLNAPLTVSCDREITLPDPADPTVHYTADLALTNCA